MLPLNPFLSAFFRSPLPAQCTQTHQLILLVPTTDLLLTHHEADTGASAQEILLSEEFIASHVLRIPGGGAIGSAEPAQNLREVRGKAKQYSTLNSRSVVIKDGFVYSNKGAARPRRALARFPLAEHHEANRRVQASGRPTRHNYSRTRYGTPTR
ncbi:MAG: hypothetical protein IMZ46_01315 [Acidobacteria bacterium]|nr:hypothetical protein [Acidobacteriota bacterium]